MNKKVLTLCVSTLLASTVMASAADPVLPQDYVPVTITPGKVIGDAVENLPLESDGKLYHLAAEGVYVSGEKSDISVQNQVLSLTENGTIQLTDLSKADASSVGTDNAWTSSLWCVHITKEAAGQNMIFDFTNSMRGMMLSVSVEGWDKWTGTETTKSGATVKYNPSVAANSDGGEVSGWKFYPVYDKMTGTWFLGSYVNDDGRTMAVLAYDKAEGKDAVVGVKVIDNATYANEVSGLLRFTLNEAVDKVLTADEFNTILGTLTEDEAKEGVQLTFVEDSNHPDFPNLFSQTKIHAEEAGDGFVYLYKVADYKDDVVANRSYIHVDTAYTNANSSSKFLQFAYMEQGKGAFGQDNSKLTYIGGLGKFVIYYNATEKRIYLRAKAVYNKPEGITYWSQLKDTNAEVISINDLTAGEDEKGLKNWVDLQDLVGSDDLRIITIKTDEESYIHTKVDFGFGSCNVNPTDRTSEDNGLYVISNEKGQVLAAPIHANYGNGQTVEWVTLDEQDPLHMPAYQWAVTKTQKSEILQPTSPLKIVNREFTALNESSIQLRIDDETGALIATGGTSTTNVDDLLRGAKSLTFTQITDTAILGNPYLGYKHLKSSDLQVTKYTFNYLNPFTMDQWIANGTGKDSVLYVNETASLFALEEGSTRPYGITAKDYEKTIPGLAQLVRTTYAIAQGSDNLVEAAESKYAMGTANVGTKNQVDTFFLKENNHYNDAHFYAIIAAKWTNKNKEGETLDIAKNANKVGVTDDGMSKALKVQVLGETRTSAFAIEEAESPLYRRFNNVELEGNEGDASDTLRFVEIYRNEVLQIEGNENFKVPGIDFLGIYTEDKAPSGLSFIVDTAWVTRGLGYIKPQYLISIERDDVAATPGVPCDATNHKHMDVNGNPTDSAHCSHAIPATPAIKFGKYLVNFQDSVNNDALNNVTSKYAWKEYTRAGFVKAINYGDSLYILKDQFAGVTKADVNEDLLEEIIAANKIALAKGEPAYIVNLTGDAHKYVTWSMRYVKPGDAIDKTFLMESMKDVENNHPIVAGKYDNTSNGDIAPEYAAWLKMQNGCLVLSDSKTSQFEEITGGDDALIFDVEYVANDEIATENESIVAGEVSVVATDGAVIVKGAEGKNVVVSTILGKVVANEVLNSDNETIAAPAGIVVVSVDGESFKVAIK